ncbi:MAG: peptidoglycan bridge formation glycyltransferase FemA/FemB family protein [Clostridia bacterium]|nr:peptidoglycan bridge formation glycyltransferase FemA/FemB family protein [Clostridia bacterium]
MANRYTFRPVTVEEAGEFGRKNGIFQQTKEWANFRSFYKPLGIMGFEGEEAVLSCIVYRLPVYLTPWGIGYATRGPVCDWKNEELVREFFAYYKAFAKKNRLAYTIFDPEADWKIQFSDPISPDLRKVFEECGLIKNNSGVMMPSNNYRISFNRDISPAEEEKRIYANYTQGLRTDIENAKTRGIVLEKVHKEDLEKAIDIFYDLFVETHEKKGFGVRNREYYHNFAQNLKEYVTIYLYRYDHRKDIALTQEAIDGLTEKLNVIGKEFEDPTTTEKRKKRLSPTKRELESQLEAKQKRIQQAQTHKNDPYLSAWFFLSLGNQTHYLYGANSAYLRDLRLTSTYHDMVADSIAVGAKSINMGGSLKMTTDKIEDDPMYDVYLHKSKHNGEFVEFPGEYLLITKPKLTKILRGKLNYFRRVVFRAK